MTTESREKSRTHQLVLFVGLLGAIVAGMLVALLSGPLLRGEERTARAAPADYTITKSDGVSNGSNVVWTITITSSSNTSETVQLSDTYDPNGTATVIVGSGYDSAPGDPLINCAHPNPLLMTCDAEVFAGGTTIITVFTSLPNQCEPATVFNSVSGSVLGQPIVGPVALTPRYEYPGNPDLCNGQSHGFFELCKEWTAQGVMAANRDFIFSVSDTSEVQQVTIPNVEEGGPPACVLVEAAFGDIVVTEVVPPGFDTPDWLVDDEFQETSAQADFFLDPPFCRFRIELLVVAQVEAVVAPACTITFVNEDNDRAEATPSPTPTFSPPCITCGQPQPTSTNTPQPPTATPSNTPIPPPTATPTTGTGSQAPGLTDEQRTQTAVAGERTAAALITPKPPATGSATPDTTGQGTNLLLVLVGLSFAAGGLGLVARRRR